MKHIIAILLASASSIPHAELAHGISIDATEQQVRAPLRVDLIQA